MSKNYFDTKIIKMDYPIAIQVKNNIRSLSPAAILKNGGHIDFLFSFFFFFCVATRLFGEKQNGPEETLCKIWCLYHKVNDYVKFAHRAAHIPRYGQVWLN